MRSQKITFYALVSVCLSMLGYIWFDWVRDTRLDPYHVVSYRLEWVDAGHILLRGTFVKNERGDLGSCDLDSFLVYGTFAAETVPLTFEDAHGREELDSREAGHHSLAVLVDTGGIYYDTYEIRTRHICQFKDDDGKVYKALVSRVFATFKNPPLPPQV